MEQHTVHNQATVLTAIIRIQQAIPFHIYVTTVVLHLVHCLVTALTVVDILPSITTGSHVLVVLPNIRTIIGQVLATTVAILAMLLFGQLLDTNMSMTTIHPFLQVTPTSTRVTTVANHILHGMDVIIHLSPLAKLPIREV